MNLFDCHRDGGDYSWFGDNLTEAEGAPFPEQIDARWAFDGMWNPEERMPSVLPYASLPRPRRNAKGLDPENVEFSWIAGRNALSHTVYFGDSNPPQLIAHQAERRYHPGKLEPGRTYYWRVDEETEAGVVPGEIWRFTTK